MKIKSKRTTTYISTYTLSFTHNGAGFGFDCDKDGNVDTSKLHPCALESYKGCCGGTITRMEGVQYRVGADQEYEPIPGTGTQHTYTVSPEIKEYNNRQVVPAVGECDRCGEDVHLHGFTNTCECGADYNMSGQLLACRSQWGEETGESLSDILSADTSGWDSYEPNTYGGT